VLLPREECEDLLFAMRGAGSSFAVVTRLTLRLLDTSFLSSALSVVSLDLGRPKEAAAKLQSFMSSFPHTASVTLFGLDAWFKAAAFQLRFASSKAKALFKLLTDLKQKRGRGRGRGWVHFVVEVSWAQGQYSLQALEIDSASFFSRRLNSSNNGRARARDRDRDRDKDRGRERGEAAMEAGSWSLVNGYGWRVASYDLVWGSGHAYAGASIGCGRSRQGAVTGAFLAQYAQHLAPPTSAGAATGAERKENNSACSDCVAVLHRVGPGLRGAAKKNTHFASVNTAIAEATLWVEMDCGVFARHSARRLASCNAFVDRTQLALESACEEAEAEVDSDSDSESDPEAEAGAEAEAEADAEAEAGEGKGACFHYPNVPSLASPNWRRLYFGSDGTEASQRLERAKQQNDPSNLLSHAQSLRPSAAINSSGGKLKSWACRAAFWSTRLRDARRAIKAFLYARVGWALAEVGGRRRELRANVATRALVLLRRDAVAAVAALLAVMDTAFFIAKRLQGV